MKKHIALLGIGSILLSGLLTGCNQKPTPITEGTISGLRWVAPSSGDGEYTLSGVGKAIVSKQFRGDVDMYGVLYPTCLEVRFVGDSGSHVQIIPMSQIIWLEFGDGGVAIDKK